ncbi:MAG TPA: efflux RND transporter periplasmic adaptor subunit [Candidatus Acidoferrales bacterium]|jgi:cobalt-zinc-cadmium efflux system membrane fusion protein|nr:efflux RND transporter periplasmic adaptor subunit [Candidatus Acidoferrales bacterium]
MRSNHRDKFLPSSIVVVMVACLLAGCGRKDNAAAEAPPSATVVPGLDVTHFSVDHPERYPVATAAQYEAPSKLVVTGSVYPDVSRTVPVVTLASGRVVDIRARLGDTVKKGQLLLRIRSDDVSGGYDGYRKAIADELLARKQLDRAKLLYEHGAIATQDLEVAQDTEDDAKTTLDTATEHLKLLGNDPEHPNGFVDITSPISGEITDQEVVNGSTIQSYSANPFTISDLSSVWIVCDVYESDITTLGVGEPADVRLNAFPDKVLKGRVSNIGALLDPTIRTAKVRIEVPNPGMMMRIGMFATATFYGLKKQTYTSVPATAIIHLHDRDWVYMPAPNNMFQRVEVKSGDQLPNQMAQVLSGLQSGQKVVSNALALQTAIDNE